MSRFAIAMGLGIAVAACQTAKQVRLEQLAGSRPSRVWVVRANDSTIMMEGAREFRGRLVGFINGKYREFRPDDVKQITVRRFARGKTLALIGIGAVGFTAAAIVLSGRGNDFDHCVGSAVDCRELPSSR